jgi:hypothetical protein
MPEHLDLPTVTITKKGGYLVIEHKKSGMVANVSMTRLDSWCLRILRGELTQPKAME